MTDQVLGSATPGNPPDCAVRRNAGRIFVGFDRRAFHVLCQCATTNARYRTRAHVIQDDRKFWRGCWRRE